MFVCVFVRVCMFIPSIKTTIIKTLMAHKSNEQLNCVIKLKSRKERKREREREIKIHPIETLQWLA